MDFVRREAGQILVDMIEERILSAITYHFNNGNFPAFPEHKSAYREIGRGMCIHRLIFHNTQAMALAIDPGGHDTGLAVLCRHKRNGVYTIKALPCLQRDDETELALLLADTIPAVQKFRILLGRGRNDRGNNTELNRRFDRIFADVQNQLQKINPFLNLQDMITETIENGSSRVAARIIDAVDKNWGNLLNGGFKSKAYEYGVHDSLAASAIAANLAFREIPAQHFIYIYFSIRAEWFRCKLYHGDFLQFPSAAKIEVKHIHPSVYSYDPSPAIL